MSESTAKIENRDTGEQSAEEKHVSAKLLAAQEAEELYPDDATSEDQRAVAAKEAAKAAEAEGDKAADTGKSGDGDEDSQDTDKAAGKKSEESEESGDSGDRKELGARAQKRIGKLTAKLRAAEAALKALKDKHEDSGGVLTGDKKDTTDVTSSLKPDPAKYDLGEFDPKYLEDKDAWLLAEAERRAEAKLENKRIRETEEKTRVEWETRVEDFNEKGEEKYEDFSETVLENEDLQQIGPALAAAFVEAGDTGVEAAYYLAKNPEELDKVVALSDVGKVRWFGKFEAAREATPKKAPKAKLVSDAKAVKYPKGSATGANIEDVEDYKLLYPDDE